MNDVSYFKLGHSVLLPDPDPCVLPRHLGLAKVPHSLVHQHGTHAHSDALFPEVGLRFKATSEKLSANSANTSDGSRVSNTKM